MIVDNLPLFQTTSTPVFTPELMKSIPDLHMICFKLLWINMWMGCPEWKKISSLLILVTKYRRPLKVVLVCILI
jgi:hypothetical protein